MLSEVVTVTIVSGYSPTLYINSSYLADYHFFDSMETFPNDSPQAKWPSMAPLCAPR